jgi:hypothetical protein
MGSWVRYPYLFIFYGVPVRCLQCTSYHRTIPFLLVQPQGDKELKREVGAFDIHRGVGENLAFVCGASVLDPGRFDTDPASVLPHYGS